MFHHSVARRNAIRGPHGELIVTLTYSNLRYHVTMRVDGAIQVKHGDWLSKYSAAMYNDFTRIHEFGRMDHSGVLRPIHNVNLIHAGETVYHIPTYMKAHPMRMAPMNIQASPLSEEQRKKVIVETLKGDFDLAGERLEILEEAAHRVHEVDTAVQLAEIAGLIAEESALAAAASALQAVSAFLTPVMLGIAMINVSETDMRLAGMQAIGYALTAWAFGDPIPSYPSSLKANFAAFPGKQALPRVEQAWKTTAEATVRNLEAEAVKKRVRTENYRIVWQALGSGSRKKLVRLVMEARAEELRGVEKDSFWGLNPDGYPN